MQEMRCEKCDFFQFFAAVIRIFGYFLDFFDESGSL